MSGRRTTPEQLDTWGAQDPDRAPVELALAAAILLLWTLLSPLL